MAFGCTRATETCLVPLCQILTLGNALQPEKWPLLGRMLAPKVQILIDEILQTRPYGHLQGWFLIFYFCHVHEKSNYGYTSSGGWTFREFVDFRLYRYIYICIYVYIYISPDDHPRPLKTHYLNNFEGLLGVPGPFRHAEDHCVKFSPWETPYNPRYDHF